MGKNITKVTLSGSGTFTIPAGVKVINVYGVVRQDLKRLASAGSTSVSLVLLNDGTPIAAGDAGALTNNMCNPFLRAISQSFPVPTIAPKLVNISALNSHVLGQDATGRVYGWGQNQNGELGNLQTFPAGIAASYPVLVANGTIFKKVSAGRNFSVGLKADGSVYAWGLNTNGQLGDGTNVQKSSPVQVLGGHSFIDLVAGYDFVVALKANGQAWTWGANTIGQLGDGTVVRKSSPVQVVGGLSFAQVVAGDAHVLGRLANGNVYAWGDNFYGEIGNNVGATIGYSSPVQVVGGQSFASIYAGYYESFGFLSSGVLYSWGYNSSGQLGDNTTTNRSSPVLVLGGRSYYEVSTSSNTTVIAFGRDGNIYAWGSNSGGAIGDGTSAVRSTPVLTQFGRNFTRLQPNVLLNVYTPTAATVAYNLNDPESFNDLMNQYAGILYDSLILEFQS